MILPGTAYVVSEAQIRVVDTRRQKNDLVAGRRTRWYGSGEIGPPDTMTRTFAGLERAFVDMGRDRVTGSWWYRV